MSAMSLSNPTRSSSSCHGLGIRRTSRARADVASAFDDCMKGFGLAIDDYGTGYFSLEQLSRIPFTQLKIDQAFVPHAGRKDSTKVIVQSSLQMARHLKSPVASRVAADVLTAPRSYGPCGLQASIFHRGVCSRADRGTHPSVRCSEPACRIPA